MQTDRQARGNPLHQRNITVTTYPFDDQRMVVEGVLRDDRFQESHTFSGEVLPPGVVHHMTVSLRVAVATLAIEEVAVDLSTVPDPVCRETMGRLEALRGLTITRGFSAKVKRLVGGNQGCTHLVELLLVMAPAAFQGLIAFRSRRPSPFDPERARRALELLFDTCRAWRDDGPFVARFRQLLRKG